MLQRIAIVPHAAGPDGLELSLPMLGGWFGAVVPVLAGWFEAIVPALVERSGTVATGTCRMV